jgi:hypothetical protein
MTDLDDTILNRLTRAPTSVADLRCHPAHIARRDLDDALDRLVGTGRIGRVPAGHSERPSPAANNTRMSTPTARPASISTASLYWPGGPPLAVRTPRRPATASLPKRSRPESSDWSWQRVYDDAADDDLDAHLESYRAWLTEAASQHRDQLSDYLETEAARRHRQRMGDLFLKWYGITIDAVETRCAAERGHRFDPPVWPSVTRPTFTFPPLPAADTTIRPHPPAEAPAQPSD